MRSSYTACSLLVMLKNLCSKLDSQKGFNLIFFSCIIVRKRPTRGHPDHLLSRGDPALPPAGSQVAHNPTLETRNPKIETSQPRPEFQDPIPQARNSKHETRNSRLDTRIPRSQIGFFDTAPAALDPPYNLISQKVFMKSFCKKCSLTDSSTYSLYQ